MGLSSFRDPPKIGVFHLVFLEEARHTQMPNSGKEGYHLLETGTLSKPGIQRSQAYAIPELDCGYAARVQLVCTTLGQTHFPTQKNQTTKKYKLKGTTEGAQKGKLAMLLSTAAFQA